MNLDVIYNKSCQRMDEVPDDSVDLMPTDPQYGWHFMGKDWDRAVPSIKIWEECFRVLKPGAFAFIMSGPRLDGLIENGMRIREAGFWIGFTPIFWAYASGFPKAMNMGKAVQKLKMGVPQGASNPLSPSHGKYKGGCSPDNVKGQGFGAGAGAYMKEQGESFNPELTAPQAQALAGSYAGFQPKPAVEVILVAMKPLSEKTYIDQGLKNEKGVTWLDDCRIPYQSNKDKHIANLKNQGNALKNRGKLYGGYGDLDPNWQKQARFPANLLVSDDVLNDGRVSKSTGGKAGHTGAYGGGYKEEYYQGMKPGLGDSGPFSRYFSLDTWFEKRLKELPPSVQKTFPFLIVPKASKAEKNRGCEGLDNKLMARSGGAQQAEKQGKEEYLQKHIGLNRITKVKNNHPTCKPIKLMSYLITLGSREGDVVLDPFIGSGTTAIAAKILRRHYIGYEIEADYCKIAKARLSAIEPRLI